MSSTIDAAGAEPSAPPLKSVALGAVKKPFSKTESARYNTIFDRFASVQKDGEKYLNFDDFLNAIAPDESFERVSKDQYGLLFQAANQSKTGLIKRDEFLEFGRLLGLPDAEYQAAFRIFDRDSDGRITLKQFKQVYSENIGPDSIPFNFKTDWFSLYVGRKDENDTMDYNEFTQLIRGVQAERLRQAFDYVDKTKNGRVNMEEFKRVMLNTAGHKLSSNVLDNLEQLLGLPKSIPFVSVVAFSHIIRDFMAIEKVVEQATKRNKDGMITKDEFLTYASEDARYSLFTPLEADMLFKLASGGGNADEVRVGFNDVAKLLDPSWQPALPVGAKPQSQSNAPVKQSSFLYDFLHSIYSFGLGGLAGGIGATVVYPIDLVKTRLQNQRSGPGGGTPLYNNSIDCVRKVFRNEGARGFYRGLGPQLIGVAPEKAIKLTVNDLIRYKTRDPQTGQISLPMEIVAGGTAGGCQVIFTNPLEIVKIRLQIQGEVAKAEGIPRRSALWIVRSLGVAGLYKGASACLLRDVPFSAIYFPAYAHLKKDTFGEGKNGKKLSFGETLLAAAIAGMPAAYFTTPADVIKTRLQVEARKGQTTYKGIGDAFGKIMAEEGIRAFFKGGPARVLRSSPQFGTTLVAYEFLQQWFPFTYGADEKAKTAMAGMSATDPRFSYLRSRNALKLLLDMDSSFGRKSKAQA